MKTTQARTPKGGDNGRNRRASPAVAEEIMGGWEDDFVAGDPRLCEEETGWADVTPAKGTARPASSASPSARKAPTAEAHTKAQAAARKRKCGCSGWYQADREWSSHFLYAKAKLTLLDQAVHRELLVHLNPTGKKRRECFPGYQHIADHIGCHRVSVHGAVHRLASRGFVVITKKRGESHDYYVRTWREVQQHVAKARRDH